MINTDPNHVHTYDEHGHMTCCTLEEKINVAVEHDAHDHVHDAGHENVIRLFVPALISFVLLLTAIVLDNYVSLFFGWVRVLWYTLAYLPVGLPVLNDAAKGIARGEFFTEFLLMSIATIGAFVIGVFPEGVAVMLFYSVGEVFQTLAVKRAKKNIKNLLDQRPDEVTLLENNQTRIIKAEHAKIGSVIQLKPGEKLALDGELLSDAASFNTAALTGESKPDTKTKGETVFAGMVNLNTLALVTVTTTYTDSKLSKILDLVQHATSQKAKTELFIRKFAKIYTPAVVVLAVLICIVPAVLMDEYVFQDWLYRALIFLVISCPCALVISIPLGYFGGIGAASRNGILFKGSNFLDIMADVRHVVLDKTGTLTKGVFNVQSVHIGRDFNKDEILKMVNALESKSTHPVATAIHESLGTVDHSIVLHHVEEFAGLGLKATINNKELLVGNFNLIDKFSIAHDIDPATFVYTVVAIAYDKKFVGYLTIADEIKEESAEAISALHKLDVKTTILSGDKTSVVKSVAKKLGIDHAYGDLLPEDKVNKIKEIKNLNQTVAFTGDGVNDAPVVAISDAGIAMGGLGSDATIETADVVIQDDNPIKIPMAIRIGQKTKQLVWQNITFAFGVKVLVLILGAGGIASMWEAVFADVGVALLAILNAIRIQRMTF